MRETIDYLPSSIHVIEPQGDSLARFIRYKHHHLGAEELFNIQNFICPDWLIHILDVSAANPEGFLIERYDDRCLFDGGRDITGITVEQMNAPHGNQGNLERYSSVKRFGRPSLTLESITDDPERSYHRYLSPMISENGAKKILVACRYQMIESHKTETPRALVETLRLYDRKFSKNSA